MEQSQTNNAQIGACVELRTKKTTKNVKIKEMAIKMHLLGNVKLFR